METNLFTSKFLFRFSIFWNSVSVSKHNFLHRPVFLQWCPVFKAGSTTWMSIFTKLVNALTPLTESEVRKGKFTLMKLAADFRLLTPNIGRQIPKNRHLKMVVARHPFERLVSAYRDKIERVRGREYYHKKYARKIIEAFRPKPCVPNNVKNPLKKISREEILSQFVHGILWSKKLREKFDNPNAFTNLVPTFQEFVRYILSVDPRIHDQHWRPIYLDCHPCRTKFDLILKVETMEKDMDVVFNILSLTSKHPKYKEVLDVLSRWNNKAKPSLKFQNVKLNLTDPNNVNMNGTTCASLENTSNVSPTDDVNMFYFSQLSKNLVQKLYKLYEPDFILFHYNPDKYMDIFRYYFGIVGEIINH